jgi:hypothetical protein
MAHDIGTADDESEKQTRRAVINALEQPGSIFPANVRVIFNGKEASDRELDIAMTYVSFDRQAAKREGRKFDAIASLTRNLTRGVQAVKDEQARFLKTGTAPAVDLTRGNSHSVLDQLARISPRRPMKAPLVLRSEGA